MTRCSAGWLRSLFILGMTFLTACKPIEVTSTQTTQPPITPTDLVVSSTLVEVPKPTESPVASANLPVDISAERCSAGRIMYLDSSFSGGASHLNLTTACSDGTWSYLIISDFEGDDLSISPDGKYLAVADGKMIRLTDLSGKTVNTLLEDVPGLKTTFTAWSPDGEYIAYVRDVEPGEPIPHVEVIHIATGTISKDLIPTEDYQQLDYPVIVGLAWRPASAQIVMRDGGDDRLYSANITCLEKSHQCELNEIKKMRISTEHLIRDTPAWSQDGTRMVTTCGYRDGREDNFGLCVVSADGDLLQRLSDKELDMKFLHGPVWSPDGTRIAFRGELYNTMTQDIFVLSLEPRGILRVTKDPSCIPGDPIWIP